MSDWSDYQWEGRTPVIAGGKYISGFSAWLDALVFILGTTRELQSDDARWASMCVYI